MQSFLFTIITVCKNDLENLKKTYQSICVQTFPEFEWIVLDGYSTDGTLNFLKGLKQPNFYWKSEEDKGLYDAMNKGLSMATGNYIVFLNAGDSFASMEILKRVAEKIKEFPNCDIFYGDALVQFPNGDEFLERSRGPHYFQYGLPIYHQAFFYKRHAINNIRFRNEGYQIAADYAFTAELVAKKCAIFQVNFPICRFPLGGVSSKRKGLLLQEVWKVQRDILKVSFMVRGISYVIHLIAMLTKEFSPVLFKGLHSLKAK
ncbi:MAG: glycosyltransferase [Candidatus Dadabacteria bacterium]|nr:glycosyltransferase [Candidatus Dadabacteria bacterium]